MDMDTLAYAVKKIEDDVKEVKRDVKSLMLFMAVEKANGKRSAMLISALMSLVISLIALGVGKLL